MKSLTRLLREIQNLQRELKRTPQPWRTIIKMTLAFGVIFVVPAAIIFTMQDIRHLGLMNTFGIMALALVAINFKWHREFFGSLILTVLLKNMEGPIRELISVWFQGEWVERLFVFVNKSDYPTLVLSIFFVFFVISLTTGSIKLRLVDASNWNEINVRDEHNLL